VYYNEVDLDQLRNENNRLSGEKKIEESLVKEKAKRLRGKEKA